MEGKAVGPKGGFRERSYRSLTAGRGLVSFTVRIKETDLFIRAAKNLEAAAHEAVLRLRRELETYLEERPDFFHSLVPVPRDDLAPPLAREMMRASRAARVGPMAAVAGAMAEFVGRALLSESPEVIVENGGDLFIRSATEVKIALFAGSSPLSLRVGLKIPESLEGLGVCTSSGTVGPSRSFGKADAACVLAPSAALADAAATAVGNAVGSAEDVEAGLETARQIAGVTGAVILIGNKLGAWGRVELFKLPAGPAE